MKWKSFSSPFVTSIKSKGKKCRLLIVFLFYFFVFFLNEWLKVADSGSLFVCLRVNFLGHIHEDILLTVTPNPQNATAFPLKVETTVSILHFVFFPNIRYKGKEKEKSQQASKESMDAVGQLKLTLVLFFAAIGLVLVPFTQARDVKYCGQFSNFLGYHLINHDDRKLLSFAFNQRERESRLPYWNLWFLFHKGFGALLLCPPKFVGFLFIYLFLFSELSLGVKYKLVNVTFFFW